MVMASLCACWCWVAPVTVAAASPSTRPARVTLRALPRGRSAPSPAPLLTIQLGRRPRGAFFLSRCKKGTDGHLEPEPEPLEHPSVVDIFFKNLEKAREDHISKLRELGVHVPPDMFRKQKDEILEHLWKMRHSKPDILILHVPPDMFRKQSDEILEHLRKMRHSNPDILILGANTDDISTIVCKKALSALNLASKVMDMPSLGLGTDEISQEIVHQMVRAYATTFCKAAEDASHEEVQMDTICSILGAFRCLGAIAHILVQDTVSNLEDGHVKSKITHQLDTDYHQFSKKMNFLNEELKMDKRTEIVEKILMEGLIHAKSYVSKLIEDASS